MSRGRLLSPLRRAALPSMVETLESRLLLAGSGLVAQYYNGAALTGAGVARDDATINFNWGNGAPDNSMPVDGYSAQWTGQVQPLYSETYTFNIQATGGARLYVNGTLLINQWTNTGPGNSNGTIALTANQKYAITIQYAENTTASAGIVLSWSSPSQAFQVIPSTQLYAWNDADLGSPGTAGSSSYNAATGALTIQGAGGGVINTADNCHFVYQQMTGNVEIVARISSEAAGAMSGLMIRESLSANAKAASLLNPTNAQQWMVVRPSAGASVVGGSAPTWALPVWLRLVKMGNIITGYTSSDGQSWQVVWSGQTITTTATTYIGFFVSSGSSSLVSTTFDNIRVSTPQWGYTTSWIGNSYGGPNQFVQDDIKGIFATSDGTVIINSPYDEGGHEAAVYKNGALVGSLLDTAGVIGSLHGWSRSGGWGVTADANYIYITMSQGYLGYDQTGYPTSGQTWNCIRRYSLSTLKAAPFTGGMVDGSVAVVNTNGGSLRGLCLIGTSLYVSDTAANMVDVYNTTTMTLVSSFSVPSPQQMVEDQAGYLWVISNPSTGSPSVLRYSQAGVLQSQQITDVAAPSSLAINPTNGYLLVSDDGPSQQIRVYNIAGANPVFVSTIGVYGGVAAGPVPGQVAPLKFDHPAAIAVDAAGNIYVGFDGVSTSVPTAIGLGSVLRSLSPSLTLNWEMDGLEFVDIAAVDPASDGLDVYTKDEHFTMDYSKGGGQEATWVGSTVADLLYGENPVYTGGANSVWMQDMNGQKFMFTTGQGGVALDIYRFVPGTEIAKWCGEINEWYVTNNTGYSAIARDLNGDGQLQSNEYTLLPTSGATAGTGYAWGFNIDSNGNIWMTAQNSGLIREYTFQRLDSYGSPIYSTNVKAYSTPAAFATAGGADQSLYDPTTDTMYTAGYTALHPKASTDGTWGTLGTEIIRYSNWSTNPTLVWRTAMPYDTSNSSNPIVGKTLVMTGNRLFVGMGTTGTVMAYDTATGQLVATMPRGPEIGGLGGWLDTLQAVSAFRRSNGEYEIFEEDDLLGKIDLFRVGGITPTNLAITPVTQGQINLTWTDNCTTESGFVLQQSTDGVNFSTVATLPANMTSYSVAGLQGGLTYRFRIKATNWFDDSPYSSLASIYIANSPDAPSNLSATAVLASQINLSWTDNSTTETGFRIERATDSLFSQNLTVVATTAANVLSYSDSGLNSGTTYYYRVSAMNGAANLGVSNAASATTPLIIPAAPTNLAASVVSTTQINLAWTDNSTSETSFLLDRATDIGFTQNLTTLTIAANAVSYSDTGLSSDTTYYYRIHATNAAGDSACSNIASATTLVTAVYQAAGSVVSGTSAITPAWPAHQAGDIALLIVESANQAISLSSAAGFVEIPNSPQGTGTAGGTTATRLTVYWKRATSSAESSPTVADSGDHQIARIITFRNVIESGNPWDVVVGGVASSAGTSVSIPGATTTVANTLVVAIVANATDTTSPRTSGWANSSLSDLTERVDNNTSSGNGGGFGVATGMMATAGTYGPTTATLATSSVQAMVSVALKPAGGSGPAIPTAPSSLSATVASSSQINLTWVDNSSNETGFKIERATNSGFTQNLTLVTTTAVSATSYSDTGLAANTTYYYRVRATNAGGDSANSNTAGPVMPLLQINGDQGSAGQSDQIRVARDLADPSLLDVFLNGASPTYSVNFAALNTIVINGLSGDDTLTLDLANGPVIPTGGISYDGGTQASGDSLIIAGSSGNDAVTFGANQVTIGSGTVTLTGVENRSFKGGAGNDSLVLGAGSYTFASDLGLDSTHLSLSLADGAQVAFSGVQHLGSLTLAGNANVTLADGGQSTLVVQSLSVGATSSLDLADNALVVDYTGTSPFAAVYSLVASSAGNHWAGNGIVSHTAAGGGSQYALGIADNSVAGLASFAGQTVDGTSVLVRFTYSGDANLDGQVDLTDLSILAGSWQMAGRQWSQGDVDYSGLVDLTDLVLLASNWQKVLPTPVAAAVVGLTSEAAVVSQAVDAAPAAGEAVVVDSLPTTAVVQAVEPSVVAQPAAAVLVGPVAAGMVRKDSGWVAVTSRHHVPAVTAASKGAGVFSNRPLPMASTVALWPTATSSMRTLLGSDRHDLDDKGDLLARSADGGR